MPPCEAGKRSSIYRGVTRHRWTGRYEAHLWDKSTWNQNQNKKGKQVYLGAYDDEEAAARAYDLAALKYWGAGTLINFPVSDYSRDLEEMQLVSREEYLASLRRKSSGVSRVSKDRAFVRQLQCSQWDHSCGELFGNEYFNAMNFGTSEDMTENECIGSFCLDRKIDLTNCIKWWGSKKNQHFESAIKSSEETRSKSEEADRELKLLEETFQPTEPYQLPSLGLSPKGKSQKAPLSCLTVLLKSEAYKRLQNIAGKDKDQFQSKTPSYDKTLKGFPCIGGNEKPQDALDLMELSQKNPYSLTSLLQAPLMTNCISIEPLPESTFLTSLIPQTGVSLTSMSKKNESSLPDPFYSK